MLQENYETVEQKIREACDRCGRERSEVTLIAVSKTKPVEMLQEIYDLNQRDFGAVSYTHLDYDDRNCGYYGLRGTQHAPCPGTDLLGRILQTCTG